MLPNTKVILTALGRLLRIRRVSANKRIVEEMEREVAPLREKIRYLQVMAIRPGQSSKDLKGSYWLERAARTQVKRRVSQIALMKGRQALTGVRTSGLGRNSQTSDA